MTSGAQRGEIRIVLRRVGDVSGLEPLWRGFEERSDPSFFQSWTWTGCLAQERFPAPVLLEMVRDGATVAIALFNRRRDWTGWRLHLGETGDRFDAVFIEHNGPLVAREEDTHAIAARGLGAASRAVPGGAVVLSGIGGGLLRALEDGPGFVRVVRSRLAPFVDLVAIRSAGVGFLDTLSSNARYELRRSARRYEQAGPLRLHRAGTPAQAQDFLAELVRLHQASWTARGRPGAFARPEMLRFHRMLVERGWPRGEIDLLRVTAGDRIVGLLYNFRYRGRVSAYQSGFDYATEHRHEKPGLTCHRLAIEAYLADGMRSYDFLGGGDRYKTSLANAAATLHWVELLPRLHPRALLHRLHTWRNGRGV